MSDRTPRKPRRSGYVATAHDDGIAFYRDGAFVGTVDPELVQAIRHDPMLGLQVNKITWDWIEDIRLTGRPPEE